MGSRIAVSDTSVRLTACHWIAAFLLHQLQRRLAHGFAAPTSASHFISSSMMAFCACSRFSACWKTNECGPSITSAVTSSPRCAGRQCRKIASGLRQAKQLRVDLIRREDLLPLLGLGLLAHARPDVGVDHIGFAWLPVQASLVMLNWRFVCRQRFLAQPIASASGSYPAGVAIQTSAPSCAPADISDRATLLPSPM